MLRRSQISYSNWFSKNYLWTEFLKSIKFIFEFINNITNKRKNQILLFLRANYKVKF